MNNTRPTINESNVPPRVCAKVWFFSVILDQPTIPTIEVKGRALRPNTKIRAKIGPVTPAQCKLTFQYKLIPILIIETSREPKASKNIIFVLVVEKIMAAAK